MPWCAQQTGSTKRNIQDEGGMPGAKDPQTDSLYEEQSRWSTATLANLYIQMFPELESSDTHLTSQPLKDFSCGNKGWDL